MELSVYTVTIFLIRFGACYTVKYLLLLELTTSISQSFNQFYTFSAAWYRDRQPLAGRFDRRAGQQPVALPPGRTRWQRRFAATQLDRSALHACSHRARPTVPREGRSDSLAR